MKQKMSMTVYVSVIFLTTSLTIQSAALGQANIAPTFTNLNDSSSQSWNSGPTLVDTNATITDPDSANFAGGFLSARVVSGQSTDRLSIRSLTTVGNINVLVNDVRVVTSTGFRSIGTIVGSIPVSGTTLLRVNLKSTATAAIVTKLQRSITYHNTSTTLVSALKTLQFQVSDGDGGISAPVDKSIQVGSFNGNYAGEFQGVIQGFGGIFGAVQTTVNGNVVNVTLLGVNGTPGTAGTGTGTVSSTGAFSALADLSGLQIKFSGFLKLNADGTASGSGTWKVIGNDRITGSGTWSTFRPAQ